MAISIAENELITIWVSPYTNTLAKCLCVTHKAVRLEINGIAKWYPKSSIQSIDYGYRIKNWFKQRR